MKTAFIFSGQGAQYCGMGKELAENFAVCKAAYDEADKALGFSISNICFTENEDINKTEFTQPALLTTSIAIYRILEEKGIKPDAVAGLSLGEYSALVASGALDFSQAAVLVRKRGKFMTEAVPFGEGGMYAVMNLSEELIKEACDEVKEIGRAMISNYNAPGQIVIAGDRDAVDAAAEKVLEKGARKAVKLNVSGPFHTSLLKPASNKLAEELKNITFNDMKVPVITNLTAEVVASKDDIADILTKQVMNPVRWEQSVRKMIDMGIEAFVEIGPGKTLSSFVKKISKEVGDVKVFNIEDVKSLEKTLEGLGY